jgi:hypothetical protein
VQGELNDFTPFGYLRNPAHRARTWSDTEGGNLRTAPDSLGVEWVYPVGRDATSRAGLSLETVVDGRACQTRADFAAIGLASRHHTCLIFGCQWLLDGVHIEARFFLADDDDVLALYVVATNSAADPRFVSLRVVRRIDARPPVEHALVGEQALDSTLAPGEARSLHAALGRGADARVAGDRARRALPNLEQVHTRLVDADKDFAEACPTLIGDWPAHWREGLHHDFQTTRLLVQPAAGIFKDVWPAWMAAWPRVVLAEGTLDMLRLAYAEPTVASRAVLSLFRDAPAANVPCVFVGGQYNMLAADGSRCGTSPAWCLPFLNLQLLYARTLDRDWLVQVYPFAAAYLDWWLRHRVDPAGWIVYRCTWESGEDGNPRLDPTGSGDAVISDRIGPVELQATLAHAAGVLAFFASELDLDADRWREIEQAYRERTRRMYDPSAGRYGDWLISESRLQVECPDRPYWGIDACRYSSQSLTPLLLGLELPPEEVLRHVCPPWTLWPSWTWSLVESAAAAGLYEAVGRLAFETIDRVYRATTRRDLAGFARPLPGSSPEFWPEDWRTYAGSDAYGWGATTANLLIRHLFGFKESLDTRGWVAELTPALPTAMLRPGARYALQRLSYRDRTFELEYTVQSHRLAAALTVEGPPVGCRVEGEAGSIYASRAPAVRHTFVLRNGQRAVVRLTGVPKVS